MAKQKGILKIKGTLGDITFYKTASDGYLVRERGGIDANRIASDPAFQRTRENNSEFGRAGKAGKLLRNALQGLLINAADGRMVSRLTQQMMRVIKADTTSERGLRNVIDGECELLTNFEFNIRGKLGTTLFAPFTTEIDRVSGELTVSIPSFIPLNMIAAPTGSTHFRIVSGGAEIDFTSETYTVTTSETAILPWDSAATTALNQVNQVTANSTVPLFLVVGIQFYQEVNGQMYALRNGAFNPLCIVQVSGV